MQVRSCVASYPTICIIRSIESTALGHEAKTTTGFRSFRSHQHFVKDKASFPYTAMMTLAWCASKGDKIAKLLKKVKKAATASNKISGSC
eukprot:5619553-Amphidinium_carterae.1